MDTRKCVIVVDENLPLGIITNTAAIMGVSLGKKLPEIVGKDVSDSNGYNHLGIIEFPIPILKSSSSQIKEIREKLYEDKYKELLVIDFSSLAQSCKTYEEFINKMAITNHEDLKYLGIAIYGKKKQVNKFTGSMPLLR